jgi:hypothetical protein
MTNTTAAKKIRQRTHAFRRTTKKGKPIYRIMINVDEILANLESNKTLMAIDIPCNPDGSISKTKGHKAGGASWEGIEYYTWAIEKTEKQGG